MKNISNPFKLVNSKKHYHRCYIYQTKHATWKISKTPPYVTHIVNINQPPSHGKKLPKTSPCKSHIPFMYQNPPAWSKISQSPHYADYTWLKNIKYPLSSTSITTNLRFVYIWIILSKCNVLVIIVQPLKIWSISISFFEFWSFN